MNKIKLFGIIAVLCFTMASCEKDDVNPEPEKISSLFTVLNASSRVPAGTSTATGSLEGQYDKKQKLFTYTLTWSGLSSAVTAIHIHGLADAGFVALPTPLGPFANGIAQTVFGNPTATTTTSRFTYSLYVDGVVIKEADLLNGKFYIDIHTTNFGVATPGEIRGQIRF